MALIEQSQKMLNAVHKRMHTAQAQEFQLLVRCFREHPDSFWQQPGKLAYKWDEKSFISALDDAELVPQADPNTSSSTQRLMKVVALKQLQAQNPSLYDPIAVDRAALTALGWDNPDQFMAPPESVGRPPPEVQKGMAEIKIKQQDADTKAFDAQTRREVAITKLRQEAGKGQAIDPNKLMDIEAKMKDNELKTMELEVAHNDVMTDAQNRALDRESREKLAYTNLIKDLISNPETRGMVMEMMPPELLRDLIGEG
jgi:hypothetical protein